MFAPSVFKVSGIFLFCEIHLLTNESLPRRQKLKKEHSPLIPFSYNIFTLPTGSSLKHNLHHLVFAFKSTEGAVDLVLARLQGHTDIIAGIESVIIKAQLANLFI